MASSAEHHTTRAQNLRTLTWRALLFGFRDGMLRAIWQPFVLSLGASMSLLGLLESIGGFWGFVPTAMLPLGGWLSDRRGRKTFVALGHIFTVGGLLALIVAARSQQWLWLFPGIILFGLAGISRPAIDGLTAESTDPNARGQAYGLTNTFFAASGIVAPTLSGLLAGRYGFLTVILACAGLEMGILLLIVRYVRDTLSRADHEPLHVAEFITMLKGTFSPPPRLRSFYAAMAVDAIAFGTGVSILTGLLSRTFGFTPFQLGLFASASSVTWTITQWFVGREVDKRGTVPFLIFSELISIVVMIGWLFARTFSTFLWLYAVWGLALATWMPAFLAWLANSVSEKQRGEELGRLGAFRGIISFLGPYAGGLLYDKLGFAAPLIANVIGAVIVVVILWAFVKEPQQA
jgi:MFS family permease